MSDDISREKKPDLISVTILRTNPDAGFRKSSFCEFDVRDLDEVSGEPSILAYAVCDACLQQLDLRRWVFGFAKALLHNLNWHLEAEGIDGFARTVCKEVLQENETEST